MTMVYGVDPDETWEIDYCLEALKLRLEANRERWDALKPRIEAVLKKCPPDSPEHQKALEEQRRFKDLHEKDAGEIERYERGSGPMFRVGHAPALKAYELMGVAAENAERRIGAEKLKEIYRWEREVVRWSVRRHRNLWFRNRDGTRAEVPFETSEAPVGGEGVRPVVADRTLEVYAASGFLGPLARMVSDSQKLSESEKNV